MSKHIEALHTQLDRLGCRGKRATINVKLHDEERPNGPVDVTDPNFEDRPTVVDPEELAELLGHLPADAPIEEGLDGSVWEVIIALGFEGFGATKGWLGRLGFTEKVA